MFVRLLLVTALIAATVATQAAAMAGGLRVFGRLEPQFLNRYPTAVTVVWVSYLLVPIMIDVCLWAAFYYLSGALPTFDDATYFSIVTFTTVGYGDIVLAKDWRHVAAFEAINGWIIFGWATALIMSVIQRLYFRPEVETGKR
ncbi:potassium channel family protein [Rhizobium vallis]|nr:potassium channel family protein [Rhizobium vallis]